MIHQLNNGTAAQRAPLRHSTAMTVSSEPPIPGATISKFPPLSGRSGPIAADQAVLEPFLHLTRPISNGRLKPRGDGTRLKGASGSRRQRQRR